ncbi:putative uncharacterized protein DDB_G0284715 [Protopterus annectens]|uniref:putative uncharacterized protein DDB_G0284715 n=1 Tax=Protopterus annectens TaxID=7888 RepID=UPI001CFA4556|nr:putative uncharacterized protein DDB_G0284715 [Protopterus annectens]
MIKHYANIMQELQPDIEAIDKEISEHPDFPRYKYDYQHCFQSIEQHLQKIKVTKIKKLKRDQEQYKAGTAYPKPPESQIQSNNKFHIFRETVELNDTMHENSSSVNSQQPAAAVNMNNNDAQEDNLRRSNRIKERNNNNNINSDNNNQQGNNPQATTSHSKQGFQRRNQRKQWNRRKNHNHKR